MIITCRIHGDFEQCPGDHINTGHGCQECGKIRSIEANKKRAKTQEEFVKEAVDVHGDRFNYDEAIYISSHDYVTITCKKHKVTFMMIPREHIRSQCGGCYECKRHYYSQRAMHWLENIAMYRKIHIQHAKNGREFHISKYSADGYNKENNIVFEFYGCYFHGCMDCYGPDDENKISKCKMSELYDKTKEREDFIEKRGFKIISIWEHDYMRIQKGGNDAWDDYLFTQLDLTSN